MFFSSDPFSLYGQPLGFRVDDAKLKRAGLDYWPYPLKYFIEIITPLFFLSTSILSKFKNSELASKKLAADSIVTYLVMDFKVE